MCLKPLAADATFFSCVGFALEKPEVILNVAFTHLSSVLSRRPHEIATRAYYNLEVYSI